MIFCSGQYGLRAVELLERHDAHEVVREGHRPEGEAEVRLLFEFRADAVGRTDQEAGRAFAGEFDFLQLLRELFGGQLPALRRQDAEPCAPGNFRGDQSSLLCKAGGDLRGVRIVGQARLRQLDQGEFAVAF